MTKEERKYYVKAILTASRDDKMLKKAYDELITKHKTLFNAGIHKVNDFLPWHRYYILEYENLLRKKNCR